MKNFRGFEELTIEFPEKGSAVFVGVNGAGKTSVLEGIMYLLFAIAGNSYKFDKRVHLGNDDIKAKTQVTENVIEILFEGTTFSAENRRPRGFDEFDGITVNSANVELMQRFQSKLHNNDMANIPFFVYYPTNRLVPNSPSLEINNNSKNGQLDAFKDSFSNVLDFKAFFEWFRNTEDLENEIRLQENSKYRDKGLEAVRKAITLFLPDFSNFRIKRQGTIEFIIEKNGEQLSISNLSHGEKAIFAMIGDLVRRLSLANPLLLNPHEGKGIVLVDEVDLHLHPGWQRTIVPRLEKTFPNIQFILTTHSPQVLSTMKRENVFILEGFKLVSNTPHTFGKDSNSILYDLFGVSERPEEAKKDFKKLYRLIDDAEKVEEAKEEYQKMKDKYGDFDPEILRAGRHFEFLID